MQIKQEASCNKKKKDIKYLVTIISEPANY